MTVEFLGETLLGRQWVFRKKKKFFAVVYFESLHPKSTVFTHVQKISLPLQKGSWEILIKSSGESFLRVGEAFAIFMTSPNKTSEGSRDFS